MKEQQAKDTGLPYKYIRIGAVCEALGGLSTRQIYLMCKRPDFPKPVKLSKRCIMWRSDELQAWMDSRERAQYEGAA